MCIRDRYKVGGWIAIVTFWSNGFNPLPFLIIKSASVGIKGFVTKLVKTKKNNWIIDKDMITQGISPWCLDWFCKTVIVAKIDKINSQKSNEPDWPAHKADIL